jgi:hypothetical protein
MTTHGHYTSLTNAHSANKTQGQQTQDTDSKNSTQKSATAFVTSGNTPRVDFINNAQVHRSTDGEPAGQRLTQGALTLHQSKLSRFHADPSLVLAAQQAQHARLEAAARILGFDLPSSATRNCTGMTPVGRYMAEQVDGEGPWTGMTRRR